MTLNKHIYVAGCFDIIHNGHINILHKTSKLGTLIVGVATDNYIYKYKQRQPFMKYSIRKKIIENIKGVSFVIPHDEKKSIEVYDKYNIDILVIGSDYSYTESHFNRLKEAIKRDIKIIMIDRTQNISSTLIIKNAKK